MSEIEVTVDPYERLLRMNLGCRTGDRIAVVTDREPFRTPSPGLPDRLALASRLAEAARRLGAVPRVISYPSRGGSGAEPPFDAFDAVYPHGFLAQLESEGVREALLNKTIAPGPLEKIRSFVRAAPARFDIVVIISGHSLTHTRFRQLLSETGRLRMASMPGIEPHMFAGALAAHWPSVAARSEAVAGCLSRAVAAEIETISNGMLHRLQFSLDGRNGRAGTGLLNRPGAFGNLPGGEAFIAPQEGTADGSIAIGRDGSCRVHFAKGEVKRLEGSASLVEELQTVFACLPDARHLGEFGVGTNERARDENHVLEAEKILGTVHIALGDNSGFGGSLIVPYHRDLVAFSPTLRLSYPDGTREVLLECGAWLLAED